MSAPEIGAEADVELTVAPSDTAARLGIEPVGGTPQQFAAMADADRARWKKIITDRKLTAD